MEENKLTRAQILIIQAVQTVQEVMATSFPKNQGKVQFDTVVRVVEDFATSRYMWRKFHLRPEEGKTVRDRVCREIGAMESLVWLSPDGKHVKLTAHGSFVAASLGESPLSPDLVLAS